jgi:hypothetical protein
MPRRAGKDTRDSHRAQGHDKAPAGRAHGRLQVALRERSAVAAGLRGHSLHTTTARGVASRRRRRLTRLVARLFALLNASLPTLLSAGLRITGRLGAAARLEAGLAARRRAVGGIARYASGRVARARTAALAARNLNRAMMTSVRKRDWWPRASHAASDQVIEVIDGRRYGRNEAAVDGRAVAGRDAAQQPEIGIVNRLATGEEHQAA